MQFDKDTIKGAPPVDFEDGRLSQDEEAELYRYYGIDDGEQLDPGLAAGEQGLSQDADARKPG